MAKERATYLSNMNGRIGNIVIRNYRDGVVTGVRPKKPKGPASSEQLRVRKRFAELARLTAAFAEAIEVGIRPVPQGMLGARNIFMRLNKNFVTINDDGVLTIDYDKLRMSSGSMSAPAFKTPKMDGDLLVEVTFPTDTDNRDADANDKVYLFVYQTELGRGMLSDAALRSSGKVSVTVPAAWSGTEVHVYGFAVGQGRLNYGRTSHTTYLGKGSVE